MTFLFAFDEKRGNNMKQTFRAPGVYRQDAQMREVYNASERRIVREELRQLNSYVLKHVDDMHERAGNIETVLNRADAFPRDVAIAHGRQYNPDQFLVVLDSGRSGSRARFIHV
ncbi:hypothetical protein HY642_03965 [Candidatus Woesearchaeota archaeon]|nr:hypothetical protein [Candidatus Woesearchaeota archaeon]